MKVYQKIVSLLVAKENCIQSGNEAWQERHQEALEHIERNVLPSGAGFDEGTKIVELQQDGRRLMLQTSFHHMSDTGMYDGWTEHIIKVRADLLQGFTLDIGGPDRNGIKDYIADTFYEVLDQEYAES